MITIQQSVQARSATLHFPNVLAHFAAPNLVRSAIFLTNSCVSLVEDYIGNGGELSYIVKKAIRSVISLIAFLFPISIFQNTPKSSHASFFISSVSFSLAKAVQKLPLSINQQITKLCKLLQRKCLSPYRRRHSHFF